jgi:hypothetical protein
MGLGSGIRKKPIPDPGSRGQKGTGSWIPDPQHWVDYDRKTKYRKKEPALPVPEVSSQLWKIKNVLIFLDSPVIIVGC